MKPFAEIPYAFLKENYFLLSLKYRTDISSYRYEFPLKNRFEDFDGTIGEYVDMLNARVMRTNKSRDVKLYRAIHDAGIYIENLYDILEGDLQIPLYYIILIHLDDDRFRTKNKEELRGLLMQVSPFATTKEGISACGYSLEEERKYNFKAKLAINWPWVKEDYINYTAAFTSAPYIDVIDGIHNFVNAIAAYKPFKASNLKWNPDEAFEKMFKYRCAASTFDYNDIAEYYGVSSENVRLKVIDYMHKCADVLLYQYTRKELFWELYELFNQIKSEVEDVCIVSIKTKPYLNFWNKMDVQTRNFVEKFLQFRTYGEPEVIDEKYIYTSEFDKSDITAAVKELQLVFSKSPLPIDVRLDLPAIVGSISQKIRRLCQSLIEISDMFVRREDGDSEVIMLKYQYLRTQKDRIVRILFELPDNESTKSNLLDEYNRRAKLYGLTEVDELTTEDSDYIEKIGRTGVWRLKIGCFAGSKCDKNNLINIVRQYLCEQDEHTNIDFYSIVKYVKESFGNAFQENSIRTTLNNLGYVRKGGIYVYSGQRKLTSVVIIQATAELLSKVGKPMKRQQLLECLSNELSHSVNYQTFSLAITRADDLFEEKYVGREVVVSLKEVDLKVWDFKKYAKTTRTPDYHYELIQTSIDELLRVDGHRLALRELKGRLVKFLPNKVHDTIIYKVLRKETLLSRSKVGNIEYISLDIDKYNKLHKTAECCFESSSSGSSDNVYAFDWEKLKAAIIRNYGNVLVDGSYSDTEKILDYMRKLMRADDECNQSWRILELLNRLFFKPTTHDERELLAFKMVFELENFLRNICIHYNREVKEEGFISIVNYMQRESLLPARHSSHKINAMIGRIRYTRNNYAHKGNSTQVVSDTIKTFLEFYFGVSEYVLGLIN